MGVFTMPTLRRMLGHEGRTVEILKIEEACPMCGVQVTIGEVNQGSVEGTSMMNSAGASGGG